LGDENLMTESSIKHISILPRLIKQEKNL
jgi:hypothetical protein